MQMQIGLIEKRRTCISLFNMLHLGKLSESIRNTALAVSLMVAFASLRIPWEALLGLQQNPSKKAFLVLL